MTRATPRSAWPSHASRCHDDTTPTRSELMPERPRVHSDNRRVLRQKRNQQKSVAAVSSNRAKHGAVVITRMHAWAAPDDNSGAPITRQPGRLPRKTRAATSVRHARHTSRATCSWQNLSIPPFWVLLETCWNRGYRRVLNPPELLHI